MSLNDYLDGLLGEPGPETAAQWETYLASALAPEPESCVRSSRVLADSRDEHILLERQPWPTLHSLLGFDSATSLTEDVGRITLESEHTPEPEEEESEDASAVVARLHSHLSPAAYVHLMEVLASGRGDEEIQSDLVEILGFEGEGFALVELVLRPGARRDIIAAERGGKVRRPPYSSLLPLASLPHVPPC